MRLGTLVSRALCIGLICCLCLPAFAKKKHVKHHKRTTSAHTASLPSAIYGINNLQEELNQAVSNVDSSAVVGVAVKSMKYGDTLYTRNAQQLFVPASTLKVLTAAAALVYLGPGFKFPTSFVTDGRVVGNVLEGNLYLVHSGDPSLKYEDLVDLMTDLKSHHIQEVNGNIYIDNTAYDQTTFGPGWIWNDTKYCYAAPISASIINHNCLSFRIAPGKSAGQYANIIGSPGFYYSGFQNSVVTKSGKSRSCYISLKIENDNTISVSGCMSKGRYAQGASTVIVDVLQYNKSMMQSLFHQFYIQVNGNIDAGVAPLSSRSITTHESEPLSILIRKMLKMSDNIIAGSLFKKIGELYSQKPGSWENGSTAVTQILSQKAGMNTYGINILDGSGLSRDNHISPMQMLQVLDFSYHHAPTSYDFISALPIAGIDGTLKRRLGNVTGRVRAKTGTMSGVVSLAGYAVSRDKEPIAFVIMVNGQNGLGWRYKEMEDRIVTALTKYSRQ